MADSSTLDYSGVTMSISADALISKLLPLLVAKLASNPQLLGQLTQAVTTKVLQSARTTGNFAGKYAGGTPTMASTKTNTNAIPR